MPLFSFFRQANASRSTNQAKPRRGTKRRRTHALRHEQLEQRVVFASELFAACIDASSFDFGSTPAEERLPHPVFAPGTPAEVIAAYEDLEDMDGFDSFNFSDTARWSRTATNGTGLKQGDPTTITWSFAQDGSYISGYNGEPASPSNLRSFLGGIYGSNSSSSRPEDQPWFQVFVSVFDRWNEVSGVNYVYEPNDDGAAIGSSAGGIVGVRGDVRISGHYIDGPSNILGYNFYPTVGDMILDTGDTFYNVTSNNSLRMRNTVAHELGHGLGLGHVTPTNGTKLMEPSITLGFDGPQHDDILAVNRGYGDRLEKNGGNDTVATAHNLGTGLSSFTVDMVSIDDDSDIDYFRFTVGGPTSLNVTVSPVGATYTSNDATFNSLAQSNLALQVYGTNGTSLIAAANINPAGFSESLTNVLLPGSGTYYVRVAGDADAAQMYKLTGTLTSAVPGPEIQVLDGATDIADNVGLVDFGSVVTGQPASKTFTIVNQGTSNLTLGSSISVPSGYALTQGLGTTSLAPGASTNFTVALNTTVIGTYSGQISFANNDTDENPFNFNVTGSIVATPVVPTLPFSDDFNRANSTALGSSWTERVGDLVIASNALQSNTTSVSLATVNSLTPSDVVMSADIDIGTGTATRSFGLVARHSGSGDGNWYLGNIRYTGGSYRAEIWKQANGGQTLFSSTTLSGGAGNVRFEVISTSLKLYFNDTLVGNVTDTQFAQGGVGVRSNFVTGTRVDNFSVTAPGTELAPEIQVLDGATDLVDGVSSVNLGSTTSGNSLTRTFTVRNQGTGDLTLGTIALTGGFTLAQNFGATTLAPNASTTFVVALNTTTVGTYNGQISFATNDADENPFNFNLTGSITAALAPEIQVLDGATDLVDGVSSANLGSTTSGNSLTRTFTVRNDGTSDLTLGSIALTGGFTLAQNFGATTLAPNASTTFVVALNTTTIGNYNGQVSFATNDADENPFTFNLTGSITAALAPEIQVLDGSTDLVDGVSSVNLGSTTSGNSLTRTFTVRNQGTGDLTLDTIALTGGFTLAQNFGATTLAPNASTTFVVALNTTTVGTYNGQISFATNDADENPFNFNLTGSITAALAPEIQVLDGATDLVDGVSSVNLGSTTSGNSLTRTFTVRNDGTSNLTLGSIALTGGFTLAQNFGATTLAPNASTTFVVALNTTTPGTYNGQVSFATNDADENPFNFNLTGSITESSPAPGASFSDDFNRANSTELGSNWTERTGDLVIASNALQSNTTSVSLATVNNLTPSDVVVSADIDIGTGTATRSFGLVARHSGSGDGNWYLGNIRYTGDSYRAEIWKQANGGQTLFSSTTLSGGAGNVRFEVIGTSLKLYFNDTLVGNVTDTQFAQGGVGVRSNFVTGTRVDNFSVTAPLVELAPEIQVLDGSTDLVDGVSSVNLGSTTSGNSLTRTFTVRNEGTSDLTLGSIALTGGYTLAETFGATTLAPNASTTFVVALNTTTVGTYNGQVSFVTNDADENPFTFNLTGSITAVPTEPELSFSDNFDRANSTALGSSWTERTGNMAIVSNALSSSTTTVSLATVNNVTAADVILTGDINIGTGTATRSLGLVARQSGSGDGNWYLGNIRYTGGAYRAEIWKQVNGVQTLMSSTFLSGGALTARFEVVGTSLKLYVNDILVGNTTDSQLTTGAIGVRTNFRSGLSVDNFTAISPVSNLSQASSGNATPVGIPSVNLPANNSPPRNSYAQAVDHALAAWFEAYQNNRSSSGPADDWWR